MHNKKMWSSLVFTAIVAVLFLFFSASVPLASAQEKSFEVKDWQTIMDIKSSGDIAVQEKQSVQFNGSFSFYTRAISHRRLDDITNISVYDETHRHGLVPLKDYDISPGTSNGYPSTNIKLHFAITDALQIWTIKYTVKGGLGFFEDHDELYWNVIPSERTVPIDKIKTTVRLAKSISKESIQQTFYENGIAKSTARVVDGRTIEFSGGPAGPGTDFTIVVGWPPGDIDRPGVIRVESTPDKADVIVDGVNTFLNSPVGLRTGKELKGSGPWRVQVRKYGISSQPQEITVGPGEVKAAQFKVFDTFGKKLLVGLVIGLIIAYILLPVWLALFLYLRWRKTGRDPKGRGTIIAEFEPPNNENPSIVGTVYDEKVDIKDLTAGIVDLAVRGFLEINELPKKHHFSKQDYEFVKKRGFTGSSLSSFEKKLLIDLFGDQEKKKLSSLRARFYSNLPTLLKTLYEDVTTKGYFVSNPDKQRKKYQVVSSLMISLGLTGAFFYGIGIPVFIAGFVVMVFGRLAPQRTMKGVLAKEKALGFKLYLNTAERYVIKKMTPKTFERFLPYAMVFGIEKQWATKFKDIYRDIKPDWYHGASGQAFNSVMIANAMSSWSTASTTALASRPGGGSSSSGFGGFSSGSSGFSGGFSGGGGGGGGISAG